MSVQESRRCGVLVMGSINVDTVLAVDRFPVPGETRLSDSRSEHLGGKGQTQAIAVARFGASVRLIGAVGSDREATLVREALVTAGVDIALVRSSNRPTGHAVVVVDESAENLIVVHTGANSDVRNLSDADRTAIATAELLLVQLELGTDAPFEAIRFAHSHGVPIVLNAAPAIRLADDVVDMIDYLIVNEVEVLQAAGENDLTVAATRLAERAGTVLVTRGGAGGMLFRRGEQAQSFAALDVSPVDTTGAGDACCGVFAAAITEGRGVSESFQLALIAGSLSTLRHGSAPSAPVRSEVFEAFEQFREGNRRLSASPTARTG